MHITALVGLALFYILFPALTLYLCHRYPAVDKIGAGIICYGVGILISVVGLVPQGSSGLQNIIMTITVPLSIPLMLFGVDFKRWSRLAGKTFLSLVFMIIAVLVSIFVGYLIFKDTLPESWQIAGMLIGVYTGGTANLNAIGLALKVPEHILVLTNTADMLVCATWFAFILLAGQRLLGLILPPFSFTGAVSSASDGDQDEATRELERETVDFSDYRGVFSKRIALPLLAALGLAVVIFGLGGALYAVVPEEYNMAVLMLSITTLGIFASFIPRVRNIEMTFHLGQYIILIFCVVVGSMADIRYLVSDAPAVFIYTVIVVYGSWLVHVLLSIPFRIDTDTTIITSTSALFSPPFVPVVAAQLKNKEVVVSGLATGIIGYAIGNYLGITIAYLLK
ncbi:MAG: DUF819 family protein [Deltaproteobacteria bacterium]|nr:DUF819 family protein [Candidatus Zymogenaceae bacterium]